MDDAGALPADGAAHDQTPVQLEGNKLVEMYYPALTRLLGGAPSDSEPELEIVPPLNALGKRHLASTSNGTTPKQPRLATYDREGLEVLHLHFTLDPSELEVDNVAEKRTFVKALLAQPHIHAPAPLTPVEFTHTRGNPGKASPSILVTLPESRDVTSRTKLISLDPRDNEHRLVNRWAAGRAAASFGEASVLDACLLLQGQGYIVVNGELSVHFPANVKQLDDLTFHLTVAISILPSFYALRYPTNAKRLFIDRLFPPASSSNVGAPREASVNLFYSALKRAPRTVNGIPVVSSSFVKSRTHTPIEQVEETDEQRETRLRREAKGKGRAVETEEEMDTDDEEGDGEGFQTPKEVDVGPEDELLYPPGLKPTLMPFQSRTVRWLLSREGKRVRPRVKDEGDDIAMGEAARWTTYGGEIHLHDHGEEDLEDDAKEDGQKGDNDHSAPILEDLPEEELIAQRRGPLWESIIIPLPSPTSSRSTSTRHQQFWINRVTSSLSIEDPGVKAVSGAEQEVKSEEDVEDEEDEAQSVELHWGSGNNGLLAEEVGLGKTVEVLSLILLNPDPDRLFLPSYLNPLTDSHVKPTPMTLIIAPAAIVGQWEAEIAKHAPGLRVLRYDAIKKIKETWTPEFIASKYDILLTTFDVLRREVVLARKPHERALRSGREGRHRYRRSLLVQIDFLRIILDEAQMLGDQASATSETASLIPRKFSFCVTSTPLKSRIGDLQGLLAFLRVEPFGASRGVLSRLLEEVPTFVRVCESLGARTLKAQVDHELIIPPQARFVVPVDFTAVEKYWYDSRYAEALDVLGLASDGTPKNEGVNPATGEPYPWTPNQGDLNRWLVTLRQVCCHPQIGKAGKEVLGNVLKTHDEVLASMLEKALSAVWGDQRQLFFTRVKRAQYLTYDKEDCERFETAIETYGSTLLDLDELLKEVGDAVKGAWELRKARIQRAGSTTSSIDADNDGIAGLLSLGLADEEDAEDHKLSEKDRRLIKNLGALRNRLRDLLYIQHKCHFFSGSAYYNMGKFPDEESEAYARAERLRVVILNPYERNVDRAIRLLDDQQEERDEEAELDVTDLELSFAKVGHGIVAREAFEDATTTVDISNGYAELIWSWRESILGMMKTRVSIAGDDATGEEYEARAALQEKLNCYLEAYTVILDDWRHALLGGHRSALATQLQQDIFGQDKQKVYTKANRLQRKKKNVYVPLKKRRVPCLEEGDTPEEILRFELLVERIEAKGEGEEQTEPVPLRHIIGTLKEALDKTTVLEEKKLLELELRRLKKEVAAKEKVADRLRSELSDVTKAFNSRLRYFAQLQVLSDEVQDPTFITDAKVSQKFKGFPVELATLAEEEEKLEASIEKKASARRYLAALNAENAQPAEETTCTICSDVYTKGVLTVCGHLVCQPCFTAWIARNRQCPLCRRLLGRGDWEVVKYRHRGHEDEDEQDDDGDVEMLGDGLVLDPPVKLSTVDGDLLTAIESVDTVDPLSSKSDFIVKHISHIRREDPTAKCLVFSCWQESLNILMTAMLRNGIGFVYLEAGGKKEDIVARFHQNPNVAVFFLHTKSQSAGLNLTCAQYVFLVEPLLHPSLEVQAIARVHRIGQTQQTTVFQYYVADTVDQRVAELRGRQGTSLFLPKRDSAEEARVNQRDMATKSKHGAGDETIEDEDDIARCLLHPEHYLALQRSLLPSRLQLDKKEKGKLNGDVGVGAAGRAGQAAIARSAAE